MTFESHYAAWAKISIFGRYASSGRRTVVPLSPTIGNGLLDIRPTATLFWVLGYFYAELSGKIEMTLATGALGVLAAAFVAYIITWSVSFIGRLFDAPVAMFYEQKERADAFQAKIEAERLSLILAIIAPQPLVQFRSADFAKVPIEIAGWMFQWPVTITNRSTKSKLSLDISLRIKMKPQFPAEEYNLMDSGDGIGKMLWKFQEQLRSPLSVRPQESVSGIFYFWTGPIMDEKLREGLSDLIEKENDLPIANLDIKNLITDEVCSVKIPTAG